MGTSKLSGKPEEMLGGNLRWTSNTCRRSSNTLQLLHATETRIHDLVLWAGTWLLKSSYHKIHTDATLTLKLILIFD